MLRKRYMAVSTLVPRIALAAALIVSGALPSGGQRVGRSPAELGRVDFPTSCSPAVGPAFLTGVALLHSFWFSEGEKTFKEVLAQDPTCAIADWGLASIMMTNPFVGEGPTPLRAAEAQAAIDRARQIQATGERERDYLEAAAAYYTDFTNRTEHERAVSRANAYEALAAKYPSDDEAQIFSAMYLAATQSPADQTYAALRKAASVLEKQFVKHPDHPGVAHYLIHAYDAPPLARFGLTAARRYSVIAPAAPHALHMPSHIFTRLGLWQESATTNRRSVIAAEAGHEPIQVLHAMDFMVYADLQLARDGDARATIDAASRVKGPAVLTGAYALAAMPARYALERGAWSEAARLQPSEQGGLVGQALTYFARGLGAARSRDLVSAQTDLQQIVTRRDALAKAKNVYWATEVDVMRLADAAWIALAQQRGDEALSLMRQAADIEDKSEKSAVTPGRLLPARELLGDMLLELRRPAEALQAFETSQRREPNRFRGLYGAGLAAAQSGDPAKAARYFRQLVAMAGSGDPRSEIVRARTYLANK
jgi:tetratricopeptide (TPR) repeat protein